ncbi:MAG: hypothetical protein DMG93_02985 [Acidobacteria bacterium]|nr:MAG: hypothetical protein DMG93_02985 [Acidobacteriota bacterium]
MPTYFNLHSTDQDRLMADNMRGMLPPVREYRECPITTEHMDRDRRLSDLCVKVSHSRRDELIIWCWVEGCLIHKSLLLEFERSGFSGYRLRPASVRFRDGYVSEDYQELIVTGWAGVARLQSGIRIVKNCPACHWKKYSGITDVENLIDWSQWTGEDFFIVWPMPGFMLITERVAELLLRLKVRSFELRDLYHDFDQWILNSGYTVSRLSNFLPEDLAIKYGAPIGLE